MLSAVMVNVIMLNVVLLSVGAPFLGGKNVDCGGENDSDSHLFLVTKQKKYSN